MPATIIIHTPQNQWLAKQAVRISSLEKNPANGKMPAMARQPKRNVMWVMGMYLRRPPIAV